MFHVKQSPDDTIAAIATPLGYGGVGVVKVSGKKALPIIKQLFKFKKRPQSRRTYHGWLKNPETKQKIDEVVVAYYKKPKSYTGEDLVEISCHGGPKILQLVEGAIIRGGAVRAGRGEFTKRAFLNGKLDLTQAEAIVDLIEAKTQQQTKIAINQLGGWLKNAISQIRDQIMNLASEIEGEIDFPEDVRIQNLKKRLLKQQKTICQLIKKAEQGRVIKNGIRVAITGAPNVGKSSLLNALIGERRAIVHNLPGTTRDTIEETITINNIPFIFVDTAGIRNSGDEVEMISNKKTKEEIEKAEIIINVVDNSRKLNRAEKALIGRKEERGQIIVINKGDKRQKIESAIRQKGIVISVKNNRGINTLKRQLIRVVQKSYKIGNNIEAIINERHKERLIVAHKALERAIMGDEAELIAIDLKEAMQALGEIIGLTVTEEIIENIFNRFCVGK